MSKRHKLSLTFVREAISYDASTGKMTWKHRPAHHFATERAWRSCNSSFAGKEALASDDGDGYRQGHLNNISLRAHVVAVLLMTGKWPTGEVDHINGKRSDNRWSNLREVTRTENARNTSRRIDNTSGVTGVVWHWQMKKWYARIGSKSLGLFDNIDDARQARMTAQATSGYTQRHGSVAKTAGV